MSGRRASQTGYSKTHPLLLGSNPTLASVLKGPATTPVAFVDNANLAASLGFGKASARTGRRGRSRRSRPRWTGPGPSRRPVCASSPGRSGPAVLLWLHYVNPHTPYTPPPPFDTAFLDARAAAGRSLPVVSSLHGGIPYQWAVRGQSRLGYYVAQYERRGRGGRRAGGTGHDRSSLLGGEGHDGRRADLDHGESLGEHDYYFDHGENLFDPSLRIP